MPTVTTTANTGLARPAGLRTSVILIGAIVVAVALNAVVAAVAVAMGAPTGYGPLTVPAQATLTVIGVVVGWLGWRLVDRRARRRGQEPARILSVLVPVVVVLSFVPDVLLLVTRFVPGTTTGAVLALMVMHVVVAAVAVPAYLLADRRSGGPAGQRSRRR
ncbi:hypothetical protein GCM10011512_19260 [Tersicoccus solisilvae]|uniref:Uncharacterized protein n=1 Tax=Tersicoccus solisilvae TaxID=1882339 RepID=A0ABQ1P755_9MICC|nr:DUF6069 family protein [Tersicoccus solisilvae]GGC92346.1 hypothetical protein GCM10011512_19260 [Tersicoccus solisilvae]